MKKLITTIALLSITSSVFAASTSPQNLVLRPLVLADSELAISGAVLYGEQTDKDEEWRVLPGIAYGLTQDLTLGFGEVRYRFMSRHQNGTGLELTAGLGFEGQLAVENADDSDSIGVDLAGKYVISNDTALLFSTKYVHWNEDDRKNRSEIRYGIGIQQNIYKNVTAFANYTFSDLKDFNKNSANSGAVGVNYAYSKSTDVGMFANYSDFDAVENGYKADDVFEKSAGIYLTTRF